MSDCTIAAQVLEKREEPAEYLVDRMIRICRDQLMLPIRQTMERIDCHGTLHIGLGNMGNMFYGKQRA